MIVRVIGCGEAFDPQLNNSCFCLEIEDKRLLIDCGYNMPQAFWKTYPEDHHIDYIYLTHWHGDHLLGLPALLQKWREQKRQKPLTICGQMGTEDVIRRLMDIAYPSTLKKLSCPVHFMESDESLSLPPFQLQLARSSHSRKNLSVRVDYQKKDKTYSLAISGDGGLTPATEELYRGVDLLIHEGFSYDQPIKGHTTIREVIQKASQLNIGRLVIVHIVADILRKQRNAIDNCLLEANINAELAEEGSVYVL